MDTSTGSAPSTTTTSSATQPTAAISTATATIATVPAAGSSSSSTSATTVVASVLVSTGSAPSTPAHVCQTQPLILPQQQQQLLPTSSIKQDDGSMACLSLPSGISESQRSISAAPSASSSPILSPPGKIFGRNLNGTMVSTSRPSNEAEVQLYRVLQRASLLIYYDTLLEMGGDDVQQLYEAGEEEFLEIMALVGMASKPLHVRRLQKVLHEWANNPSLFQGSVIPSAAGLFETPTKQPIIFTPEPSPSQPRTKVPVYNPTPVFNPTPLLNTAQSSSTHLLSQVCTPAISVPVIQPQTPTPLAPLPTTLPGLVLTTQPASGSTAHQVSSSSPQLTPVLTEMQISRITLGAEKIANQLPQREPRAQTSKKRTSRELEQVMAMSESNPRRMEEIRKYSAIYGRFDCKRRPEKPLTLHEVCVNEAAAQLCRLVPALLTRRDELFPLARQIVKDAGFGHSASIARYGNLLPQVSMPPGDASMATVTTVTAVTAKRQRLSSTETTTAPELSRDSAEDSRYNLFAMYQKFAKPPFDLTEMARFSSGKPDYEDNDNDSRFSFSNSSSPPMPTNGSESERDPSEQTRSNSNNEAHSTAPQMAPCAPIEKLLESPKRHPAKPESPNVGNGSAGKCATDPTELCSSPLVGVQVISASGGHIIAVANPALALSPTLNEALSLKREADSPDI